MRESAPSARGALLGPDRSPLLNDHDGAVRVLGDTISGDPEWVVADEMSLPSGGDRDSGAVGCDVDDQIGCVPRSDVGVYLDRQARFSSTSCSRR